MILGQTVFGIFEELISCRTVGRLEPRFRGHGAKMSNTLQNSKWTPWVAVSKTANFFKIGWTVIEKLLPKYHLKFAICSRPEVAGDVICSRNVKTIEGYLVVNLKSLALIVLEILKKKCTVLESVIQGVHFLLCNVLDIFAPWPRKRGSSRPTVRHEMSSSNIPETVWPRIIKFYVDIHTNIVYSHTGYDVIIYFRSAANRTNV